MTWYTLVGGLTGQTDTTIELVDQPGTVRRLIVSLIGAHTATGVGSVASFHWIVNVGSAAADPNIFGPDAPSTMLHGAALIPDEADFPIVSPAAPISIDSDGDRIIGPGESLWLRMRGGAPATDWTFTWSLRVLLL